MRQVKKCVEKYREGEGEMRVIHVKGRNSVIATTWRVVKNIGKLPIVWNNNEPFAKRFN